MSKSGNLNSDHAGGRKMQSLGNNYGPGMQAVQRNTWVSQVPEEDDEHDSTHKPTEPNQWASNNREGSSPPIPIMSTSPKDMPHLPPKRSESSPRPVAKAPETMFSKQNKVKESKRPDFP